MTTVTDSGSEQRYFPTELPPWSLPIGRVWGRLWCVSYTLVITLAILCGVVAMSAGRVGSQGLVLASAVALGIWFLGFLIQAFAYSLGLPANDSSIGFGLVGVQWQSGVMTSKRTLQATILSISVMVAVSSSLLLASRFLSTAAAELGGATTAIHPFSLPRFDLISVESVTHLAGWLLLVQCVAQLYPLPFSLGRHFAAALVVAAVPTQSRMKHTLILHRVMIVLSIAMAIFSVGVLRNENAMWIPRWPLLMLLAFTLARTSRIEQIQQLVDSFDPIIADDEDDEIAMGFWDDSSDPRTAKPKRESLREFTKSWFARRRLRHRMQQERVEAIDAAKLDEILERLHHQGAASLSRGDREVLRRVSESLRRERQKDRIIQGDEDDAD
ncbi:hypothetical protein [Novipirellula artificiosorum]|uniref:Transmembrane protein n=1 Tax=Novipirellula artificiosorum TaxID=2528016 RepID=A0A5C6E3J0_9BACT|nr:hypothetical protein [Novipirellula artificiosorum]TWU42547.1 hypothetical protein Poly41_08440 [Novipirellula artificiosorum]